MQNLNDLALDGRRMGSDPALAKQFLHHLLWCTPLLLIVPLLYVLAFNALGPGHLSVWPFCLGLIGWLVALLLRAPLLLVFTLRLTEKLREQVAIAMSGPVEELVRLLIVLFLHANFASAFALGLGWASIEVLYAVISGFTTVVILSQGGVQAWYLKKKFEDTGQTVPETVYWGVIERLSATALHIGFTLLLAYHPLLILITLPLHSLVNLGAVTLNNRSALKTQTLVAVVGTATLLAGIRLLY